MPNVLSTPDSDDILKEDMKCAFVENLIVKASKLRRMK